MATLEEQVREIIVERLYVDAEKVTPEASFIEDLNADSLATIELILEFEKAFDIKIPDDDAEKLTTVGQALEYLKVKLAAKE